MSSSVEPAPPAGTIPELIRTLRDLAASTASAAGKILAEAIDGTRVVDTKSTGTDMVTEMDRASEEFIVGRIISARPDDAIVGEEGTDRPGSSGVTWHIDPLDGTTNYLYRLPGWNVSIGAEIDGEPVAGAVSVPGHGDLFSAGHGLGATRNGVTLRAGRAAPLASTLVGTGFGYDPEVRHRQAANLVQVIPHVRDIRRVGAAAADLCAVASGRLDAYYESGLSSWDRSAGIVIAREAGLRVESIDAHPLPGVLTIAAHPERWDEFCALLVAAEILPGDGFRPTR